MDQPTIIKIFVIKNKEIEATSLEEAKQLYAKKYGVKTFTSLQEEAKEKALSLHKDIVEMLKQEALQDSYTYVSSWNELITRKLGFFQSKSDKDYYYLNTLDNSWMDYEAFGLDIRANSTSKRTTLSTLNYRVKLINCATKAEYMDYIENFENFKEKVLNEVRETFITYPKEAIANKKAKAAEKITSRKAEITDSLNKDIAKAKEELAKAEADLKLLENY